MSETEEVEDFGMFEEPEGFRPPSPKPTLTVYKRVKTGEDWKVSLPPRHSLWAHELWNAGKSLANYIDRNPELVQGKRILEMGAAASLPSIMAAFHDASLAVSTDYPDQILLENIKRNAVELIPTQFQSNRFQVEGFLWGDSQRITELTQSEKFDIIFLADVIFNHSEHHNLLVSCRDMLKGDGYVLTTFSHHVTRFADRDLEFFNVAKALGFEYELVYKEKWDEMFPEDSGPLDLRQTVNCFKLIWTGSTTLEE